MTRVGIISCTGRMGQALIKTCHTDKDLKLTAGITRPGHKDINKDLGDYISETLNIAITDSLNSTIDKFDVLIDFSLPTTTSQNLSLCVKNNKALVLGTTGLNEAQLDELASAARKIPIVFAPNMSIGVNVCLGILPALTQKLADIADIEIIEAHHRNKIDAPSGTALKIGETIANAINRDLDKYAIYGRQGQTGIRDRKTIGFSTIRGGDIIGDHTALFALPGETVELTHKATNRNTFAQGAALAAKWLAVQKPGLYDMQNVLGLKS